MRRHNFPFHAHPHRQIILKSDYSTDAIIYVTVVVVFYAGIIILLLTTNFRRKDRGESRRDGYLPGSVGRKHWLFFNSKSSEALQATRKDSRSLLMNQNAETV